MVLGSTICPVIVVRRVAAVAPTAATVTTFMLGTLRPTNDNVTHVGGGERRHDVECEHHDEEGYDDDHVVGKIRHNIRTARSRDGRAASPQDATYSKVGTCFRS